MKKLKIVLWIIVLAFIGLVFFQNKEFFLAKQVINLNLSYVADTYQSPELPHVVWFLLTLCIGLLVAYFFGLTERFKLKKIIKGLKAKIDTQMEMISQIRSELESRNGFSQEETPVPLADTVGTIDTVETAHEPRDVQASSDD